MENVNTEEYIVKPIGESGNEEFGVFKVNGSPLGADRLIISFNSKYDKFRADQIAATLNYDDIIQVVSYTAENEGSIILSELYRKGYRVCTHAVYTVDGTPCSEVIVIKV